MINFDGIKASNSHCNFKFDECHSLNDRSYYKTRHIDREHKRVDLSVVIQRNIYLIVSALHFNEYSYLYSFVDKLFFSLFSVNCPNCLCIHFFQFFSSARIFFNQVKCKMLNFIRCMYLYVYALLSFICCISFSPRASNSFDWNAKWFSSVSWQNALNKKFLVDFVPCTNENVRLDLFNGAYS